MNKLFEAVMATYIPPIVTTESCKFEEAFDKIVTCSPARYYRSVGMLTSRVDEDW